MNQQQVEEALFADPYIDTPEILEMIKQDQKLAMLQQELQQADAELAKAFDVEIPEGLEARLKQIPFDHPLTESDLDDQTAQNTVDIQDLDVFSAKEPSNATMPNKESNVKQINFSKPALALAASVIFSVGLAAGQINWGNFLVSPANAQVEQLVNHIQKESHLVPTKAVHFTPEQINSKLEAYGLALTDEFPYPVNYVNNCGFINGEHALHMHIQGQTADITVFIAQEEMMLDKFEAQGFKGINYPLEQGGYIVLMTQGDDDLAHMAQVIAEDMQTVTNSHSQAI